MRVREKEENLQGKWRNCYEGTGERGELEWKRVKV